MRLGFDHQYAFLGAGDNEVQLAVGEFVPRRV